MNVSQLIMNFLKPLKVSLFPFKGEGWSMFLQGNRTNRLAWTFVSACKIGHFGNF